MLSKMFVPVENAAKKWPGFTLVVPAVSVGNVGQLSADVLISTFAMKKVGHFYDESFLPVVGNDPYVTNGSSNACDIMTAADVYESVDLKVVVVQQRSPLVKGKRCQYVEKLMSWITDSGFSEVIVLTSSYSHERLDSQLTGSQLRYLMTPKLQESSKPVIADTLKWIEMEQRPSLTEQSDNTEIFIPGSGIAKMLYLKCCECDMNAAVLLTFCSEGDNAGDAIQLVSYLNSWKQWATNKDAVNGSAAHSLGPWKIPSSWKLMYGNRFDPILFR